MIKEIKGSDLRVGMKVKVKGDLVDSVEYGGILFIDSMLESLEDGVGEIGSYWESSGYGYVFTLRGGNIYMWSMDMIEGEYIEEEKVVDDRKRDRNGRFVKEDLDDALKKEDRKLNGENRSEFAESLKKMVHEGIHHKEKAILRGVFQYSVIMNWMYMNDKQYSSVGEWRRAFGKMLRKTLKIDKIGRDEDELLGS